MGFLRTTHNHRALSSIIGGDEGEYSPYRYGEQPLSRQVNGFEQPGAVAEAAMSPPANEPPSPEEEHSDGFNKGYQEGLEAARRDGYAQGLEQGRRDGAQALRDHLEHERDRAGALIDALTHPLASVRNDLADAACEGALNLARLLVGTALEADPASLAPVIREIVDEAAEAGEPNHVLVFHVPGEAYEAIKALAEPRGAQVLVDEHLERGDIRATLSKNNADPVQQIEWDARLETRWASLRKTLGLAPR